MMETLQQDIFDLIDGLLPLQKRKEIKKLLENNQEAAQFYQKIKDLRSQLGSLQSVKTSPDFDSDLRARIRMEKRLGRSTLIPEYVRIPSLAFAGAAAVMALFLAFGPNSDNFGANTQAELPALEQNSPNVQPTFYTLDRVGLNKEGATQLSSEGQRQAASRRDSIRSGGNFGEHIQVVEF